MKKIFNKSNRIFLVAALFLLSATAKAQTYYGITAFNEGGTATETEGGVTVTVTNTGTVLDYSGCTLEVPYWEGVFDVPGGGSYIWSFSSPAEKIRIHIGAVDGNDIVTANVNSVPYFITSANLSHYAGGCYGGTPRGGPVDAVADGVGGIINPIFPVTDISSQPPADILLDINPGTPVLSFELHSENNGLGNGVTNDFNFSLPVVTPPDTPTLSEWGLITFTLLLLSFGMVFVYRRQNALAIAGTAVSADAKPSTFDRSLYFKALGGTLVLAIAGLVTAYRYFGTLTITDTIGTLVSACIVAYMVQLSMMMKKK